MCSCNCQRYRVSHWLAVAGVCLATAIPLPVLLPLSAKAADAPAQAEAQRLVAAAVQAELAGDVGYLSLLHAAVRSDPDNKVARWQLGQLQVDGQWVSAEEAQRRAAADPLQAEYRELRAAAGNSVQDQLRLARWCRDKKLSDEAQLHWAVVLSRDPMNKEAQRAVDMLWKDGQLVNRKETSEQKRQAKAVKDAAKHWEPIIAKWRRAVSGRDVQAHDAALAEIRAINRLDAIPSIEAVTLGRDAHDMKHAEECLRIAVAFLEALAKMPDQAATQSIVRHAVLSPGDKARDAAIAELKNRDQHDYVPMLLAGLAMPIESSFQVTTLHDGSVHYAHALYREGDTSDWAYDMRMSASQYNMGGRNYAHDVASDATIVGPPVAADPTEQQRVRAIAAGSAGRYAAAAANMEFNVSSVNAAIESTNTLIMHVLGEVTGLAFETPRAWWDWWHNENGYEITERPVDRGYDSDDRHYYYGYPQHSTYSSAAPPKSSTPPPAAVSSEPRKFFSAPTRKFFTPRPPPHECFAKGTLIWSKTGQVSIESVEVGDFVLAQDVNTGELSYKPVLAKTVRPPSKLLSISLEGEQITTTLGHPIWVAGTGWRMAKELGDDARLHGINGSSRVRSIAPAIDAESYNLVVADYNTYFVGEAGILVHDNTPRRPTQAIVPGVAGK